jgi:2TM domain
MTHMDQAYDKPAATGSNKPALTEAERRERAVRRVAAIRGFYTHLAVYVAVNIGLLIVNALTGPDWWVQWVVFGWGIGIVAHALAVFGRASRLVREWEERKIKQLMAEQR